MVLTTDTPTPPIKTRKKLDKLLAEAIWLPFICDKVILVRGRKNMATPKPCQNCGQTTLLISMPA